MGKKKIHDNTWDLAMLASLNQLGREATRLEEVAQDVKQAASRMLTQMEGGDDGISTVQKVMTSMLGQVSEKLGPEAPGELKEVLGFLREQDDAIKTPCPDNLGQAVVQWIPELVERLVQAFRVFEVTDYDRSREGGPSGFLPANRHKTPPAATTPQNEGSGSPGPRMQASEGDTQASPDYEKVAGVDRPAPGAHVDGPVQEVKLEGDTRKHVEHAMLAYKFAQTPAAAANMTNCPVDTPTQKAYMEAMGPEWIERHGRLDLEELANPCNPDAYSPEDSWQAAHSMHSLAVDKGFIEKPVAQARIWSHWALAATVLYIRETGGLPTLAEAVEPDPTMAPGKTS